MTGTHPAWRLAAAGAVLAAGAAAWAQHRPGAATEPHCEPHGHPTPAGDRCVCERGYRETYDPALDVRRCAPDERPPAPCPERPLNAGRCCGAGEQWAAALRRCVCRDPARCGAGASAADAGATGPPPADAGAAEPTPPTADAGTAEPAADAGTPPELTAPAGALRPTPGSARGTVTVHAAGSLAAGVTVDFGPDGGVLRGAVPATGAAVEIPLPEGVTAVQVVDPGEAGGAARVVRGSVDVIAGHNVDVYVADPLRGAPPDVLAGALAETFVLPGPDPGGGRPGYGEQRHGVPAAPDSPPPALLGPTALAVAGGFLLLAASVSVGVAANLATTTDPTLAGTDTRPSLLAGAVLLDTSLVAITGGLLWATSVQRRSVRDRPAPSLLGPALLVAASGALLAGAVASLGGAADAAGNGRDASPFWIASGVLAGANLLVLTGSWIWWAGLPAHNGGPDRPALTWQLAPAGHGLLLGVGGTL